MEEDLKDIELFIAFCRAPYNFEHESEEKSYKELSDKIEHLIKEYKELKEIEQIHRQENGELRKQVKQLEEENKELISDNLDYQRTLDIFDKRTYRKKYLEERRKEVPNLLYPDADEIYKRYYELREENKELKKDNKRYEKELHDVVEFSIPVSLVEETIEEINKEDENLMYKNNIITVLQELLKKGRWLKGE